MDLNSIVHPTAEKAGRFLVPWTSVQPWEALGRGPCDIIAADFALLGPEEMQRILQFLPQHTLFVHTGEEDRRPIFSTHVLSEAWEDAGLEWQARKLFLDAAVRRAETKRFVLETFVRDLIGIPSGVIGLRKRGQALEIFILNGQVIFQKSPSTSLHLGSMLTRSKLCEEATIQDALQCQAATGFPFGECLVKKAYLTREQLQSSLREQVLQTAEAMAQFLPADEILLELDLKPDSWEALGVGRLDLLQAFLRALPRWPGDPPCASTA